jgi:zinc protease
MIASAPTIQAQKLDIPKADIPVFALAPVEQRVKPPAPAAPVSATLPASVEKTLANGLRVIVASRPGLPIVSADLRILSGNAAEADGHAGTADMVASVLTKGTSTRSATDIARQVESLGASLEASADADSSRLALEALSNRFAEALAIASDVTRNPAFAQEELDRQRQQTLDELSVSLKQPGPLSRLAMTRLLFGDGPYGRIATPKTIGAVKREDIVAYHAAHWRPDNAVLVIAGDISADDAFALAEKNFGNWVKPATPMAARPDASKATTGHRVVVVDLPKSGQAAVAFGLHGLARTDNNFFPLLVTNAVLGGGYSARLNQEIRIKRGLSYGANSAIGQRLAPGPIIAAAQTKNTTAVDVVNLMDAELLRLGSTDVAPDELAARSATLIGNFGRTVETASGMAGQLSEVVSFGLPPAKLQSFVADVSAVTPAQVRETGAKFYAPGSANIVVTGDAAIFYDALKKKKPDAERIPADKLNLDSPTLQ